MARSSDHRDERVQIAWAGDRFLRVSLGERADAPTLARVRAAVDALRAGAIPGLVDLTPAYAAVFVTFDLVRMPTGVEERVRGALSRLGAVAASPVRTVDVPLCYGGRHGEDLAELAALRGVTVEQAVALHSGAAYTVAFIGFTPGFAYVHGLPRELATPRLASPRARVPAGSIGIAGGQTGVYPGGTPGGWQLIGRTPLRVFDPSREKPALLATGDAVRFVPIGDAEFERLNEHTDAEGR